MADSVAQDQIKAFVERILRLKEESKAIALDIREIYAEAKGNGFDKTVLGKLVNYIEKRSSDAASLAEADAIFDLYLTAYDGAIGKVGTVRATHTHASEASGITPATVKLLNVVAEGMQNQAGRDALVTALEVMIEREESQHTANEPSNLQKVQNAQEPATVPSEAAGESEPALTALSQPIQPDHSPDAGNMAGEPHYAAPGIVTWEMVPPEGVKRHEYSYAFSDLGQDAVVIEEDMRNAASEPIVKIGADILDGWARYNKARSIGIEYPVVQYDGSDPLMDCIRWNLAGRIMADLHKRTVAQRLARINPGRRDEIYAAMELGMELVS